MMFENSFDLKKEAQVIKDSVTNSLDKKIVTRDILKDKSYTTSQVGDWIVSKI